MKRYILLIAFYAVCLTACSEKSSSDDAPSTPESIEAAQEEMTKDIRSAAEEMTEEVETEALSDTTQPTIEEMALELSDDAKAAKTALEEAEAAVGEAKTAIDDASAE